MVRKKAIPPLQPAENSPALNLATLFSGCSQHAIDGSNRIMLPSEWRGEGIPNRFFVLVAGADEYLAVCPPAVFESILAELRADIADKTQVAKAERKLTGRVRQVSLDRFGRLPLPTDLMARVGLSKQGELVGRFSRFEVWPPDKYQAAQAEPNQASEILENKLKNL